MEVRAPAAQSKSHWWIPLIACLLVIVAYANGVRGTFVYDDNKQIVQNQLIQDSRYFWKAVTEDVWAFKGERQEAWSNYWRPAFVLWLMLNYRLFGLNPAGWHVMNLALHCGVCLLLWRIARRLNIRPAVQAAAIWIFAVHPAHVESVTWIAGSTDLLMGIFLAASLHCFLDAKKTSGGHVSIILALSAFLFALLSKESAILFPAILFVCCLTVFREDKSAALRRTLPFVIIALVFLAARALVLHGFSRVNPWAPDYLSTLLTIPSLIVFYLRICLFPVWLGPSYGIRAVTPADLEFANFIVPILVLSVLLFVARKMIGRKEDGSSAAVGLSLFFFLLLPALYIRAFLPDQIVHDRYLYLPLFGFLLFLFSAIPASISLPKVVTASLILCIPLTVLTTQYNLTYRDELAFWQHAVITDPNSATSWSSLGNLLRQQQRYPEARTALERALQVDSGNTLAVYGLAMINLSDGKFPEAEAGFKRILSKIPEHESATDQLASVYNKEGRIQDLIALLQSARKTMPYLKVKYTQNLAFSYYRGGKIDLALAELESIRNDLSTDRNSADLESWFYLADLYRMQGRNAEALQAAKNYLQATRGMDPRTVRLSSQAQNLIDTLKP